MLSCKSSLALSLLCLGLASPLRAAETTQPPMAEETVTLPKYVVADTRILPQPENWDYARLPNIEVISTARSGNTRRFLHDFLVFQNALGFVWPALGDETNRLPVHFILCGADKNFERLASTEEQNQTDYVSTHFLQDKELCTIVVNLTPGEIQLGQDTIVTDPYRDFYREYSRFLIRRSMGINPPEWFEEGLVQIIGTINVDKRSIEFAHLDNSAQETGVTDLSKLTGDQGESSASNSAANYTLQQAGGFAGYLRQKALLPFKDFVVKKPEDPQEQYGWRAQSFGFVHMCLYGRQKRYQAGLLRFVEECARGTAPTEESFKRCFGYSYKDMMIELRGYVDTSDHEYIQMKAKKGQEIPAPPTFELRKATDAEYARIKGDALRQGGHLEEAKNVIIAPYLRGDKDPALLATLGRSELSLGERDRALKFLEAAFKAGSNDVRACLDLSRLRLENELKRAHKLGDAQRDAVLAPLEQALRQNQPIPELYDLYVQTWLWAEGKPAKEQLKPLIEGMNLYPRRAAYLYNCAQLCAKAGLRKEAEEVINMAIYNIPTPEVKRRFEELRGNLAGIQTSAAAAH